MAEAKMASHITGHPWQDGWNDDSGEIVLKWNVHEVKVNKQALIGLSTHFQNAFTTTPEDGTVYDIAIETSKKCPAWMITHMLPAIAYFCRRLEDRFQKPDQWYGLHGFAELFDCPELLEWSFLAVVSFAGEYYPSRSDDQFFYGVEDLYMPELAHELPKTHKLMRGIMQAECHRRVMLLDDAGRSKDALQHLLALPWLAVDMFRDLEKDLSTSVPQHEWKCKRCSAVFIFTKPPVRNDYALPSCPGCAHPEDKLTNNADQRELL